MVVSDLVFTLVSCIFFMVLVGWIAYRKAQGSVNNKDGYFLAGRGLSGVFIAGSLLMTNLSADQLLGLNGSAFGFNMSAMAWEVTAGLATIIMALVFLPRYLAGAFSTLPEFLKTRYDNGVRRLIVIMFMVGYGLITIPAVLYSGSVAVLQLFDVPLLLNISYSKALILTVLVVGTIGALYATFGGLKAVVISDTINGVGLLIVGILVPVLGFVALGEGNFLLGVEIVATTETQKLNAIGTTQDPVPFGTIFTGMIFANLFYWGTNQYVIQRTLGAINLAEGQKGVLIAGLFKLLVPFMMMIPGIIAYHMYTTEGETLSSIDLAYPQLVHDVLPTYLSGFFLAVLLGTVFSSFNSLLNSAATLFCLDVYQPLKKVPASDDKLIKVAKIASIAIAIFSFMVAPLLQYAPDGLWQIIRVFTGFYNIPVIAVVLVGLFTRRVPAKAAKVAIIFHLVAYTTLKFLWKIDINFIHIFALLFAIEVLIMLVYGHYWPRSDTQRLKLYSKVDLRPWRYALPASFALISGIVAMYLVFSPVGLVDGVDESLWFWLALILLTNIVLSRWSMRYWNHKYDRALRIFEGRRAG